MGHGHDHGVSSIKHERPLRWALALTAGFLVIELVGGWLSNSLAILSDAAHMATDTAALLIALLAVRFSARPADSKRSYGYARLEALGALANGSLLFVVAGFIIWEALKRLQQPPEVASQTMMLVAVGGLIINLIAMRLLKAGTGESLNMKGAYLEVWSDMLGSIGVFLAGILIHFTGWLIVDPILAVLIGLWVLPRTWLLLREAIHVLLEGVPAGMTLADIQTAMLAVDGVISIHDLHVWSLSTVKPMLSAHVVMHSSVGAEVDLRDALQHVLEERFGIHHTTLQIEREACAEPACL